MTIRCFFKFNKKKGLSHCCDRPLRVHLLFSKNDQWTTDILPAAVLPFTSFAV